MKAIRSRRRRAARGAVKYTLLTVAAVLLFCWGKQLAFEERGYEGCGGEYLLLLIPLIWYAVETTARDFIKDTKTIWKEAARREDKKYCANMQKEQNRAPM